MGGAGSAGAAALDIPQVFSPFVYDGNSASRNIVNGIDLTEGGLVWTKLRSSQGNTRHVWIDTARGVEKYLQSNVADAEDTQSSNSLTAFNDNGYTIGNWGSMNANGYYYASWTWRKAPKFFDVVTYSGTSNDSSSYQDIAHNLGAVPGMVIVKRRNSSENWAVWHRSIDSSGDMLQLNLNDSKTGAGGKFASSNVSNMTATTFRVYGDNQTGANGGTYVAYLFAHNNSDGGFGPSSDQDIIKCDSYTGNGNATGPVIDLGFEPQFLITKNASSGGHPNDWLIVDNIRGVATGGNDEYLQANERDDVNSADIFDFNATGFSLKNSSNQNANNDVYIYMAIRRGPLAVPTDATKVFGLDAAVNDSYPRFTAGFPVDMSITTTTNDDPNEVASRLTGGVYMRSNGTNAEQSSSNYVWDNMTGAYFNSKTNGLSWMWKRAPGYFDVVCYTGSGNNSTRMVDHNLTVKPEMVWIKRRSGDIAQWFVTTESLGVNNYVNLEDTGTGSTYTNIGAHTATQFSARGQDTTNAPFVAYLFATAAGVSKCGGYTGNGSSTGDTQTIDCGFSSGARFVLIKRTSGNGAWYVFDTARGIVSGTDKYLTLNSSAAQVSGGDYIDPDNSGFIVVQHPATETNTNGETYIFYAIA